jgi:methionyl-tRNA synthetase
VDATEPWHLARAERAGDRAAGERLDQVLGALIAACQVLAAEIWPFLPDLAARLAAACNDSAGALPAPRPLFPRIQVPQYPAPAPVSAVRLQALSGAGTAAPRAAAG